ncbi:MAG: hypothetical protein JWR61_5792 [Ferruginibacter sp.]|nr:hypothetical protein [Ferruginibacter sp.]
MVKSPKPTRKQLVLSYLKKNRKYVPGYELTRPEVGGTEGLRRLRELRADGINIISRRNPDSGDYEYKIGK